MRLSRFYGQQLMPNEKVEIDYANTVTNRLNITLNAIWLPKNARYYWKNKK